MRASNPRGINGARTTEQRTCRSDETTCLSFKTMEEYAAIDVDLIEVMPPADDPA
jgi:hypothetical protein